MLHHKLQKTNKPLYIQVANLLQEEITTGIFKNEDRLPSEERLAKMLDVSRTTVREALSALEEQGQLRRVHGVGTMIAHHSKIPIGTGLERLASYTEYVRNFNYVPGTKEKEFNWVRATKKHQHYFNRVVDKVGVLNRVRTANGTPLMYSVDILPQKILGNSFTLEKMGESLFEYLKRIGVRLAYSELTLSAIIACTEMAAKLEVKPGSPLLEIKEKYYGQRDQIVLWSRNVYRVDRWVFKMFRTT